VIRLMAVTAMDFFDSKRGILVGQSGGFENTVSFGLEGPLN
jgi:hypothetical protein